MKNLETVEAVVQDLISRNPDLFMGLPKDLTAQEFATKFHFNIGAAIRNEYGLWDAENGNQALLANCNVTHPDDASRVILQKLWQVL